MRIEIHAGGFGIPTYQSNMSGFLSDADSVISSFKTVSSKVYDLNGGVGNLQGAVDELSARIHQEEQKREAAAAARQKSNDFLDLAIRVDKQVAALVDKNKNEFYKTNPWLKPSAPAEEAPWYEKAWEWLCGAGEKVAEGMDKAWEWVKDTAKKAWDGLVEFYNEHKALIHAILTVVGAIAVLVVVLVVPGAGAVIAGLLCTMLKGALIGGLIGAVSGGIMGGITSVMQGGSFWAGAAEGAVDGAITGAIGGALFAGLGAGGQLLGNVVSCGSKLGQGVKVVAGISQAVSAGMDGFDTLALLDRFIDPNSNIIADLNEKAHSSKLYNFTQIGMNALAVFTGGMTQTMTCFVAGTLVLTAAGLVAIETIKAGDLVIATNPDTMETAPKRVLETYVLKNDRLVHLKVDGEEIITTENHPFYVQDRGFVNAGELQRGDILRNLDGNMLRLDSITIEQLAQPETVYNFQVEEYHTYYVGEHCVFVHNADCVVEFNNDSNLDRDEFERQLLDQENGMNQLTVEEYLTNRENFKQNGRAPESVRYQQQARKEALATRIEDNCKSGMSYQDAITEAEAWIEGKAALHGPDQIAGGYAHNITGMGDASINSSIGVQWKKRISVVDEYVEKLAGSLSASERATTRLDIHLILKD